jgi:TRAP-type C4-dicarboxylate transport system permease small subunit
MVSDDVEIFKRRIWISVIVSTLSLAIAGLSIYLGYDLFRLGATGAFKFSGTAGGTTVGIESVAPGLLFAFFGAGLAVYIVYRMISTKH